MEHLGRIAPFQTTVKTYCFMNYFDVPWRRYASLLISILPFAIEWSIRPVAVKSKARSVKPVANTAVGSLGTRPVWTKVTNNGTPKDPAAIKERVESHPNISKGRFSLSRAIIALKIL